MIAYKNVWLLFIVRYFVYFFMPDKNQREPDICPQHAQSNRHIAAFYPSKETCDDRKWEYEQHDCYEGDEGVNCVYEF